MTSPSKPMATIWLTKSGSGCDMHVKDLEGIVRVYSLTHDDAARLSNDVRRLNPDPSPHEWELSRPPISREDNQRMAARAAVDPHSR